MHVTIPMGGKIHLPNVQKNTFTTKALKVAERCLKELAVALACLLVVSFYMTGHEFILLLQVGALIYIPMRLTAQVLAELVFTKRPETKALIKSYPLAMFVEQTVGTLIHEFGHAAAAKLCFNTKELTVRVLANGGGFTSMSASGLTGFGASIGLNNSLITLAAGGPLLAIIVAVSAIAIAKLVQNREASDLLLLTGLGSLIHHKNYAASAIGEKVTMKTGHDFIKLAALGISPLASLVVVVGLPTIILAGQYYSS